jgi:hypothetical protein
LIRGRLRFFFLVSLRILCVLCGEKDKRMTEKEQRAAVVTEAKSWLATPFLHGARIKGVGADCETFICEVFAKAGVFTAQGIPYVPAQWFLNTKEELYLKYLSQYATEYVAGVAPAPPPAGPAAGQTEPVKAAPQPGDIICVKTRWVYSHGAIVTVWPKVIHCYPPFVMESNVFSNPVFLGRELKFFNPWLKPEPQAPSTEQQAGTPAVPGLKLER